MNASTSASAVSISSASFGDFAQLIGDDAPMLVGGLERFLREVSVDRTEHHLPLTLAGVGEGVLQEVHAAALSG